MQAKERDKFVAIIKDIIDKLKKVFANINNLSEIERLENEFLKVADKVSKMNAKENAQQKTTTEEGESYSYSGSKTAEKFLIHLIIYCPIPKENGLYLIGNSQIKQTA